MKTKENHLYLRTATGKILLHVRIWVESGREGEMDLLDLESIIIVTNYSDFLLEQHRALTSHLIQDFALLNELDTWLWDEKFHGTDNDPAKKSEVVNEVREMLLEVAKRYGLTVKADG